MRKIQRKSLSCTECTRRKLRCSKTIPCSTCIDRNIQHRCHRRQELGQRGSESLRGDSSSANGPARDHDSTAIVPVRSPNGTEVSQDRMVDTVATDAAVTLEFLALGRQRVAQPGRRNDGLYHELDLADDTLLSGSQVKHLLLYHQENLAWMHNVVHMPAFINQCDMYFTLSGAHERSWLALYFAMLAFTLYHVHPDIAHEIRIESPGELAEFCYERSIESLHKADFMSHHTVVSVQCICLLIYVGYNLGQSDKISVLLSCGVRIAQSLCMHRLGPDRPSPTTTDDQLIDREIQKRCWWFLVRQDWLQIPFVNTYSIHPSQFNTPMPKNCFDDPDRMISRGLVADQPKETYTHNSYTSVLNDVSVLIWKIQDKMCSLGPPQQMEDGMRKLYAEVIQADEELRLIMKNMPSFFQADKAPQPTWPRNIEHQREVLFLGLAHKFYSIHRHFQVPSYKDPWFAYSKVSCLPIMRHSLRAMVSLPNDHFTWSVRNLWTVNTQVVTATVWLLFDLLLSREDRTSLLDSTEIRNLIEKSIAFLEICRAKSHIARRGSALLRILLEIEVSDGVQRFNMDEIISRVEENEAEFQSIGTISVFDWLSRGPNNIGEMIEFLDNEGGYML